MMNINNMDSKMKKILIFITFCIFAAVSCSKPYEAHFDFGMDREELRFAAADTASYFMIYGDGNWTLTLSKQVSWVSLDKMSGKGMAQINVRIQKNTGVARDVEVVARYQDGREKILIISQQTSSSSNKAYSLSVSSLSLLKIQSSFRLGATSKFSQESIGELTYWIEYEDEDKGWIENLEFNYSDASFSVKENTSAVQRSASIYWTFPAAHWEKQDTLSAKIVQTTEGPVLELEESYSLDSEGVDSVKIAPKINWDTALYDFDLSSFNVSDGVQAHYSKSGNYIALITSPNTSREVREFELQWSVMDNGVEVSKNDAKLIQNYYIPPVNLTANGEYANCYVLSDVDEGYYSVDVYLVSRVKPAEDIASAAVLWESSPGLITKCSYDQEVNRLYIGKAKNAKGNTVIKMMDKDGKVLWSYHFWMTNTGAAVPEVTIGGHTFLDRNIGAVANAAPSAGESDAAGTYYQWGRKDPFPAPENLMSVNGQISDVYPSGTVTFKTAQNGVSLEEAIHNPSQFYWGNYNKGPQDWSSTSYDGYWNTASKTDMDPCPYGYVVPDKLQIDALIASRSETTASYGNMLKCDDGTTNYLCSGGWIRRKLNTTSECAHTGQHPHYWSTTAAEGKETGSDAKTDEEKKYQGVYAIDKISAVTVSPRRWGANVRCVKETKTE